MMLKYLLKLCENDVSGTSLSNIVQSDSGLEK